MLMHQWVRIPSGWIEEQGLRNLRWGKRGGSGHTAALMVLAPIAHFADQSNGVAQLTYDQLQVATGLSRAKISEGLAVLDELNDHSSDPPNAGAHFLSADMPLPEQAVGPSSRPDGCTTPPATSLPSKISN